VIRKAVAEDAAGLAAVHIGTWQVAYQDDFSSEFLASLDHTRRTKWWSQQIADGAEILVGEVDGSVAGFSLHGAADDEGWGEILAIYVRPASWSTGLGYELFRGAIQVLEGMGFNNVMLWVLESNTRARAFYERQGMVVGKPFRIEEIGGVQVTEIRYEISLREQS
jgi:GNAT superfamily N-acetyltransferase